MHDNSYLLQVSMRVVRMAPPTVRGGVRRRWLGILGSSAGTTRLTLDESMRALTGLSESPPDLVEGLIARMCGVAIVGSGGVPVSRPALRPCVFNPPGT